MTYEASLNFLITAIGSISAGTVIASLRQYYPGCIIIGTDIYPREQACASEEIDFFYRVPKAYSSGYTAAIDKISLRHHVDFILPLTDPEVDVLSKQRDQYKGITHRLALSNNKTIEMCRDKEKVARFFATSENVRVIDSFTLNEIHGTALKYPLLAKPKKGRSSEGVQYIYSNNEMSLLDDSYIIQPLLEGTIVTVDFVRDFSGNLTCLSRKELLRSPRGAGLHVEIFEDAKICELVTAVAEKLDITGCMNIEFILTNGLYYLMDINPRFSAGVGFSKSSGYDFVYNHVRVFMRENILEMEEN